MKKSLLVGATIGAFAAIVYFLSMASYAFPGESAHLMALWRGLSITAENPYPFMAIFAKALGGGNLLAPICGVIAVLLVYRLVRFFILNSAIAGYSENASGRLGTIAGGAAAIVFMLSPAVRGAATHLEPKMFDGMWALAIFSVFISYLNAPKRAGWIFPILIGFMVAFGFVDSALFVALAPFYLFFITAVELKREKRPYLALTLFSFAFLALFFVLVKVFGINLTEMLKSSAREIRSYYTLSGWLFVLIFATIPFAVSIFSSQRAFVEKPSLVLWIFHGAMTLFSILAIATPLSPSAQMADHGVLPVVTSAFAAMTAGYLVAFWWYHRRHAVAVAVGVIFAFVIVFSSFWNLFSFDGEKGAFADETAKRLLADLGERTWFVSDGTLDDHLLIVAADSGREFNLVSLARDLDPDYLEALGKVVKAKGIGGSKNEELSLSLTLGVLPFVQDWFAADPSVAKEVAIFGAPDVWYTAGLKPIPEFLFFGADETREPDWSDWRRFNELLAAPEGWGSYRLGRKDSVSPVDALRYSLRRYLGMVANNRGVYLQDKKRDAEAFDFYELVLNEIDSDNVCSLFNEIEMAGAKHAGALAKKRELERRLQQIVEDKSRRYIIWRLGFYYGYIRNPEMFIRLGFSWARSGRPGDALAQIRRAIDFVPSDKRTILLNMMAALYASENDHRKSRKIYEEILSKNANDHDALIGMMRIELVNGDSKKALEYLQRAVKNSPADGRRARIELAMVGMMKNDFKIAREMLEKVVVDKSDDLQGWSLLAAVTMQEYDATKDANARAKLLKDIEERILPTMEKNSTNPYDYYLQTTKAFVLMRQGAEKRREARDAFALASRAHPDSSITQDLMMGLDISLDDKVSAERHARDVLRRNRNAPLANYIMGSLALSRGEYDQAEAFLRKAADSAKPNVLAINDLAEVLRRKGRYSEAETYVRRGIEIAPEFYILRETLGVVLLGQNRNLDEAEESVKKAIELAKRENGTSPDVRLYTSLARIQVARGDKKGAKNSLSRVEARLDELSDFEKREYEEIAEGVL